MHILTIVGARPQFVKAAMISRAICQYNAFQDTERCIVEDIVHTGQHYDRNMSRIFFDEMGIPEPDVNLGVGSGRQGETTAEMLKAIEREIIKRQPECVMLYGDTNSTLAGALASSKLEVTVAHVEAGLRSYNRDMPEEINRVITDYVSQFLFCPTHKAVKNLHDEGVDNGIYHVGDVMYDAALQFAEVSDRKSNIIPELGLQGKGYFLATVHRAENTDRESRLLQIMDALKTIASRGRPVVLPLHPRTKKALQEAGYRTRDDTQNPPVRFLPPVSFLDMVALEKNASIILTDSGGVQKEAYFHGVPCITLRDETEWTETVEAGWNQVVGASKSAILKAVDNAAQGGRITEYGDGRSSGKIVDILVNELLGSTTGK